MTSMYLSAVPWFAETESGGGRRCDGGVSECAGFSMTVPNWEKEA